MEDREPTLSTGSRGQRPWRMQPSTNRLVGSIVPSKTDRSFLTLQARPRSNSRSQEAGVGDGSQSRRGVTMRKRRLRLLVRYLFPTLEYLRRTPGGAKSLGSQLEKKGKPLQPVFSGKFASGALYAEHLASAPSNTKHKLIQVRK